MEGEGFLEGGLEGGDQAIGNLAREQESGRDIGGGPRPGQNRGAREELEGDWRGVTLLEGVWTGNGVFRPFQYPIHLFPCSGGTQLEVDKR